MKRKRRALVTGAGGFIGHHMVKYLKRRGYWVRGVDIKYPEFEHTQADEFLLLDLRELSNALEASAGIEETYSFAANMGGVGYIDSVHAEVMRDNICIDANMLEASKKSNVRLFFYPSSACVYPKQKQAKMKSPALREDDVYPADPDTEYGWEKLYAERMCLAYRTDFGLHTKIARFHNIYGPLGTYQGGREKSPAAICRKIAEASDNGSIEIWGDGKQIRSYCYIDDCIEGIYRLSHSPINEPVNIGSNEDISITSLVELVSTIAKKRVKITYNKKMPQGVRSRNSDNRLIRNKLHWEPKTRLKEGMRKTYQWIYNHIKR